ncbi:sugar ABC transporter ATP-binding protein [Epibacterium sp. DP7N7-1]|nr:sugar ABC transporter ATP-binding protein [Epibacterium sp. DP7N7-1]
MSVHLSDILMEFPGTRALDEVNVAFHFNEVHGLVGENGAGKSTFVNILGGSLQPTRGRITVAGTDVTLSSPRSALGHGIAHVSQEGSLVPSLTGAENIMLGVEPRHTAGIMRRGALRSEAERLLATWFPGLDLDLHRPVGDLPMADRKVIEIVRALRGDIRLLILDEPTATLEAREKKQLWGIIKRLPTKGVGVVLISHFLSEVVELSDRITVLRDGKHVGTLDRAAASEAVLTDLMLRREAGQPEAETTAPSTPADPATAPVILAVEDWAVGSVEMDAFHLRRGEIVGLIGLTGAGHFGFARSLYARQGVVRGELSVDGQLIRGSGVRVMQRAGVALVPDHRMENALAGDGTVVENLTMVHPEFAAKSGILNRSLERREADRVIKLLNVKTPNQRQLIRNLSGGNKQKVSIGKWLYGAEARYKVLIFIEPTEGVDIGAKMEIYAHMRRLAAEGAAILIASSDLGEIAQVCHRAIPFVHGRPGADIHARDFSEGQFITAITGDAA